MDSTPLDNASFFPSTTIKPAIKTTQWIESIGRMSSGKPDELPPLLQMPVVGVLYPQAASLQLTAGVGLDGDLSDPVFAGLPHDPSKSLLAAFDQLLWVHLIFTCNNIPLPFRLLHCTLVSKLGIFFLVCLNFLFLCQYVLEEKM